jgi:hypothetical protein
MYETAGHLSLTKHYSPCTGSSELDSAIEMRYLAIMLSTSASMINVQHDECPDASQSYTFTSQCMIWKNFTSKATGWLWGTPGAYIQLYIIGKYALSLCQLCHLSLSIAWKCLYPLFFEAKVKQGFFYGKKLWGRSPQCQRSFLYIFIKV